MREDLKVIAGVSLSAYVVSGVMFMASCFPVVCRCRLMLCALGYARWVEGHCWCESLCVCCVRRKAWGLVLLLWCVGEGLVALRSGLCVRT